MVQEGGSSGVRRTVLLSVFVYALWLFATYMLEGRISLFHGVDPMGRVLYVLVANLVVGMGVSFVALRVSVLSGVLRREAIGLRSPQRTLVSVLAFGVAGFGLFVVQKPASLNPVVVLNVFSQVLPVSIAEVVVCWAVAGTAFEALSSKRGKVVSVIAGMVVADFLFGVYHFGHSAPFNRAQMVFFLMIPGLATSLVFFLARELYATVVFQNFFGIYGVMRSIDLEAMSRPAVPLYVTAVVSILVLVCLDVFAVRRARTS